LVAAIDKPAIRVLPFGEHETMDFIGLYHARFHVADSGVQQLGALLPRNCQDAQHRAPV
jgi:hypothetical protein